MPPAEGARAPSRRAGCGGRAKPRLKCNLKEKTSVTQRGCSAASGAGGRLPTLRLKRHRLRETKQSRTIPPKGKWCHGGNDRALVHVYMLNRSVLG